MSEAAVFLLPFFIRVPQLGKVMATGEVVKLMTTVTERVQARKGDPIADKMERAIRRVVAAFPPLTAEQVEQIAHLLRSGAASR